jgi:hypothetical protein
MVEALPLCHDADDLDQGAHCTAVNTSALFDAWRIRSHSSLNQRILGLYRTVSSTHLTAFHNNHRNRSSPDMTHWAITPAITPGQGPNSAAL